MIRDEDGELLTILGKDKEGYYVYYFEHCELTKEQAEALLDKAAGIAITPIVDEKVLAQYKDGLEKEAEKLSSQID